MTKKRKGKNKIKTGRDKRGPHKGEDYVQSEGTRIKTLDQLLEACDPDLRKYEITSHIINSWEVTMKGPDKRPITVTNWQVKAYFKLKAHSEKLEQLKEDLLIDLQNAAYRNIKSGPVKKASPGLLFEVGLFDFHLGSYAWKEETGEAYNLEIAEKLFIEAILQLLDRASKYKITRILYPVGNDFFHADDKEGRTTSGTYLDVAGRWAEVFRVGVRLQRWAIDKLREVAPVDVVVVPGNHDEQTSFMMGEVLNAYYEHVKEVQILNSPKLRTYYRYGATLFGFTHGKHEPLNKLPHLMPAEAKKLWGETTFREFHVGHHHHRQGLRHLPEYRDINGVMVRILPSLAATDDFHHSRGFTGAVRAAEGYFFDKEEGLLATVHTQRSPLT